MTVHRAVEGIGMLEGTVEDGHLGHEAAESGRPRFAKTGNDVADRQERHDLHQAGEFADVTRVGTSVDHTDEREEEGRHQAVAQHLQHSARAAVWFIIRMAKSTRPQWLTEE